MQSRIDRLFGILKDETAVFISGYPNVFYYSGFTSEDAYLLITKTERYIITDSRYFVQAKIEASDFELIDIKKGWEYVFSLVPQSTVCFEEDKLTYGMYQRILGNIKDKELKPSQTLIDKPRSVKDSTEIQTISEAEGIGDRAFSYVLEKLHVGMTELEAAYEIECFMRRCGAAGTSFDTIAASGVRSSMPHGIATDKVIEHGDFLTLDFGCVYKGYCSDMTRTVVFGQPDSRQKEIYEVVLTAQQTVIDGLHAGMDCADADRLARDIIAVAGYGENFGHALGHSVGIEIHETPVFAPKSKDVLKNGTVISVEPGIYIDGFGDVRIEDLIAIIDGRVINLTSSPKELIVL